MITIAIRALVGLGIIAAVIYFGFVAPSIPRDQLETSVAKLVQEEFDASSDTKYYKLKVKEVTLFQLERNKYDGITKVEWRSSVYNIPIVVNVDGERFMFHMKGDGLAFLTDAENKARYDQQIRRQQSIDSQNNMDRQLREMREMQQRTTTTPYIPPGYH